MKDIDFDELDRAVGSVLGSNVAAQTGLSATPAAPELNSSTVATATADGPKDDSKDAPQTKMSSLSSVAAPASDTAAKPSPALTISASVSPARKRGQFLDMVHPSADMTKTPKMPSAPRKTVTPLNPAIVADASQPASEVVGAPQIQTATPLVAPSVSEPTDPVQTVADNTTDNTHKAWPDPLDFAKESDETPDASHDAPSAVSQSEEPTSGQDTDTTEPVQTPFVTDAKVDKRPLGAFAVQDGEVNGQTPAESAAPQEVAPEFNPEVNSIEAIGVPQADDEAAGLSGEMPKDEALSSQVSVAEEDSEIPEETPQAAPALPVEAAEPIASVVLGASTEAVAPVAGTQQSISQQYKPAEPRQEDNDSHPLFDSEEYHQPLLADGKKKSKKVVLIVVMLLILLVLGAALGYIAYTVGI